MRRSSPEARSCREAVQTPGEACGCGGGAHVHDRALEPARGEDEQHATTAITARVAVRYVARAERRSAARPNGRARSIARADVALEHRYPVLASYRERGCFAHAASSRSSDRAAAVAWRRWRSRAASRRSPRPPLVLTYGVALSGGGRVALPDAEAVRSHRGRRRWRTSVREAAERLTSCARWNGSLADRVARASGSR